MTWNPTQNLALADQGVARLLEQFKNRAKFEAWIRSYLNQVQAAENCLWEVLTIRGIDASSGVALDQIGNLLGRLRLGLSDADYKIALKVEILILRSSGNPDELINIIQVATSALALSGPLLYGEAYPAAIWFQFQFGISSSTLAVLMDSLFRAKVGGVRLFVQVPGAIAPDTFTFSPWPAEVPSTTQGFADYYNPGTGGFLAGIQSV